MPRHAHTITSATVAFGDPPATGAAADVDPVTLTDYACQVTDAAVVATAQTVTLAATFCEGEADAARPSKFSLRMGGFQDWGQATSFSEWSFENDAERMAFAIYLEDETVPYMQGIVDVTATDFAGVPGTPLTWSSTWPCPTKPHYVNTPPAAMAVEGGSEAPDAEVA